jgi:hypothetical protein
VHKKSDRFFTQILISIISNERHTWVSRKEAQNKTKEERKVNLEWKRGPNPKENKDNRMINIDNIKWMFNESWWFGP